MARNIVICSDGTGNTFDRSVSNVTRLIKLLDLDNPHEQIVVYDQGIGTNSERLKSVKAYARTPGNEALKILDTPKCRSGWPARLIGLVGGYGLKANVREMYQKLSELYECADDNIFLFGFSRGAFTVRVLAALLYCCGIPPRGKLDESYFDEIYQHYTPMRKPIEEVEAFQKKYSHRACTIHFLGIWDTVKSYGGIWPIILPHLRHNPHVKIVRHALALNERRSWFNATTWGQLDSDWDVTCRFTANEISELKCQDIEEVWFRGCHSDVGGGDVEEQTARIALRWMLGEALDAGIRLNQHGRNRLSQHDPSGPACIHESLRRGWWVAEYCPRWEIDNSGLYPVRKFAWGRTGRRNPKALTRRGTILLHSSVVLRSARGPVT